MQIKAFTLVTPLIVLALGGFTSPSNVIINPTLPNITDTPIYGPFTKQAGCTTVEFNFTNNSNINLTNVQETANVYRLVGSTPLYTRTTTVHSVASKSTYSGSILFDTSYFRSYNVLILEFVITNNGNENLYKGSQTVYRATEPSLNAQDYVSTPYAHNQMTFCFSTILTKNCDERITFPSIPTTFGNDLYYKLPIDNFYFTYDAQKTFYYDEAYLEFDDLEQHFPYMKRKIITAKIPLTLSQSGTKITFKFPTFLYVDKSTMTMSLINREGFTRVYDFYMPLKALNDLDGKQMTLVITQAGYSRATITSTITYYASKNLFGSSSNSQYYITGGVVND